MKKPMIKYFGGDCIKCKLLFEFYERTPKSDRDYWLMTELFVLLHGSDECKGGKKMKINTSIDLDGKRISEISYPNGTHGLDHVSFQDKEMPFEPEPAKAYYKYENHAEYDDAWIVVFNLGGHEIKRYNVRYIAEIIWWERRQKMTGWRIQGCRTGWMVMTESGCHHCWFKTLAEAVEFVNGG